MEQNQSNNGNTQINQTRNSFNDKVAKLRLLGTSKKIIWDGRRRNRAI